MVSRQLVVHPSSQRDKITIRITNPEKPLYFEIVIVTTLSKFEWFFLFILTNL